MPEIAEFAEILGRVEVPVWELEWQNRAACKGLPTEWWFPERGASRECKKAKQICAGCPVILQCREYALKHHDQHGLWGAMSLHDRRKWEKRKAS